jgi:hypothetical protein
MQKIWRACLLIVISFVLRGMDHQPVFACSCAQSQSPQEELAAMTAVFSGRVEKIARPNQTGLAQISLKVDRVWKGQVPRSITISRTSPLALAADDLRALGAGQSPVADKPDAPSENPPAPGVDIRLIVGLAGAAAAIAIGLWKLRR